MKSFELTKKVQSEINERKNRINELNRKKRSAVLEKEKAKEQYTQLVSEGAGQHEVDKAYELLQEKERLHERYNNEHDIMTNSFGKFSVTGEEFADKYNKEYVPKQREKHLDPLLNELETLKQNYLKKLHELSELLGTMEVEQRKAERIMQLEAFKGGENNNVLINITNIGHLSNETITNSIITNNDINKIIDRYLL